MTGGWVRDVGHRARYVPEHGRIGSARLPRRGRSREELEHREGMVTRRERPRDQGRRGADRLAAGDDPHVGAALRLPRARRAPPSGYRLYTDDDVETLRRRARLPRARPVGARGARARAGAGTAPPTARRSSARSPRATRRHAAAAAQAHAARDLARDRGRDAGPRRRPGRVRRLPARAPLPRGRAPLPSAWPRAADAAVGVRRLRRRCGASDGSPPRSRSRADDALGNEWAVVVDAPGYAACLLAWEHPRSPSATRPARPRPALRGAVDAGPAVVRRAALVGARWPPAPAPELGDAARAGCWPTARSPSRRPRRR